MAEINKLDFRAKIHAIASALPGNCSVAKDDSDNFYAEINDEKGRTIAFKLWLNEPDKLKVFGKYPELQREDGQGGECPAEQIYGLAPLPSIRVNPERPSEAIAKDIARRFLPQFIDLHDECAKRVQRWADSRERRNGIASRLAKAAGVPQARIRNSKIELTGGHDGSGIWGTIHVNGDESARLELHNLSPDLAEQILQLCHKDAHTKAKKR